MNVAPLIHNSVLWGTNVGKTSRAERGGEEGLFLRLCTSTVQDSTAQLSRGWIVLEYGTFLEEISCSLYKSLTDPSPSMQ